MPSSKAATRKVTSRKAMTMKRKAAAHKPVTRAVAKAKKVAAAATRAAKKALKQAAAAERTVASVVREVTGASPRN